LDFHPSEGILCSSDNQNVIKVWDLNRPMEFKEFQVSLYTHLLVFIGHKINKMTYIKMNFRQAGAKWDFSLVLGRFWQLLIKMLSTYLTSRILMFKNVSRWASRIIYKLIKIWVVYYYNMSLSESLSLLGTRQRYLFHMLGFHWILDCFCQWRWCTCLVAYDGQMCISISVFKGEEV
jgi:hypothetical protein